MSSIQSHFVLKNSKELLQIYMTCHDLGECV